MASEEGQALTIWCDFCLWSLPVLVSISRLPVLCSVDLIFSAVQVLKGLLREHWASQRPSGQCAVASWWGMRLCETGRTDCCGHWQLWTGIPLVLSRVAGLAPPLGQVHPESLMASQVGQVSAVGTLEILSCPCRVSSALA